MRALLTTLAATALACAEPTPTLDFGTVGLGGVRLLPLPPNALALAPDELVVDPPFSLYPLAPLNPARPTHIAFRPKKTMTRAIGGLSTRDGYLLAKLRGAGDFAVECQNGPCARQRPADDRMGCIVEPQPDWTPCERDACLRHGTCAAGVCVGPEDPCDDHDVCTVDTCDANGGCSHQPIACPPSGGACVATRCDPRAGCGFENLVDGSLCVSEPADVTRRCRGLACVDEPAWRAGKPCESDTPPLLHASWRVDFDRAEIRDLAVDTAGRLAVVSCAARSCELVSLERDGRVRARVPTVVRDPFGHRRMLAVRDLLVVAGRTEVRAYDATSLDLRWSYSTAAEFASDSKGAVVSVTRATDTTLAVIAREASEGSPPGYERAPGHLLFLDTETGTLLDRDLRADDEGALTSDGHGMLYSVRAGGRAGIQFRREGFVAWSADVSPPPFITGVALGDGVLIGGWTGIETTTGALRYRLPDVADPVVIADGLAFAAADNAVPVHGSTLVAVFRAADGVPLAACSEQAGTRTTLFATSRRSAILVFRGVGRDPSTVREIDEHGGVTSLGTLEEQAFSEPLVVGDMLVGVEASAPPETHYHLAAYPLPAGLAVAAHGWVMDGGNPSRDYTPR